MKFEMQNTTDVVEGVRDDRGEWRPKDLPKAWPLFRPFGSKDTLKFFFGYRGFVYEIARRVLLAIVLWRFLTPSPQRMAILQLDWIVLIFLRNAALLVLVAGRRHFQLYVRRLQGTKYKFSDSWPTRDKKFLFNNQTWDNVFWSIASGCVMWTAYEAGMLWAHANGWLPFITMRSAPVLFVAIFLLEDFYGMAHFYFTHRLIHWKPLSKAVHYIHHKNIVFGPWSGLSMHPIEHIIFISSVLRYLVIPSHPVHIIKHCMARGIGPADNHAGFGAFVRNKGDKEVYTKQLLLWERMADYFHHLHHRYFTVNFGNSQMPLDKWLGTEHDGTPESHERMLARRRAKRKKQLG